MFVDAFVHAGVGVLVVLVANIDCDNGAGADVVVCMVVTACLVFGVACMHVRAVGCDVAGMGCG